MQFSIYNALITRLPGAPLCNKSCVWTIPWHTYITPSLPGQTHCGAFVSRVEYSEVGMYIAPSRHDVQVLVTFTLTLTPTFSTLSYVDEELALYTLCQLYFSQDHNVALKRLMFLCWSFCHGALVLVYVILVYNIFLIYDSNTKYK